MAKPKSPQNSAPKRRLTPAMDTLSDADDELLESSKAKFAQAWRAHMRWVKEKKVWERFYDGDQLSSQEKEELEKRGQPPVVINRIKPKVDGIIGIELGSRVVMKAFDRGSQDFETAKFMTEALRYVDYHNSFDEQESEVFEDVIIGGRGWYKHKVCFEDLDAELDTKWVSGDDVIKDPYSKKADLSDAKHIFETVWTDLDDAIEMFPESKDALENALLDPVNTRDLMPGGKLKQYRPDQYKQGGDDCEGEFSEDLFLDRKRKRVRMVTMWYREPKRRIYIYHRECGTKDITDMSEADRKKTETNFPGLQTWTDLNYRLNTLTFTWNAILEQKKDIRSYDKKAKFPFVFCPGYRTKGSDEPSDYGFVKQMVDPQKEINKRRSKMLHVLNVNQVIAEKGAVDSVEKARAELARPDGWVERNPQFGFEVQRGAELSAPHFQLLQEAKREIDEAGPNAELGGMPGNATSGRDRQLRQQQAVQVLRKLFANLRGAKKRVAQLWLEDIQHYWTDEKLVRITDDPDAGAIKLNQKVIDPQTGQIVVQNDVTLGKYDIIIEESPDTLNLRTEQFESLVKLAQAKFPVPFDMIIEASDLPNKKQLLERIKQQEQAQQQQMMAQAQGGAPAQ